MHSVYVPNGRVPNSEHYHYKLAWLAALRGLVVVASALMGLRSRNEAAGRRLAFAGSLAVILVGAFWFVQRIFFPGGIA